MWEENFLTAKTQISEFPATSEDTYDDSGKPGTGKPLELEPENLKHLSSAY